MLRLLGFIAIVSIIGFSTAACKEDNYTAEKTLASISVTATKTKYVIGEDIDRSTITVTAGYDDGSTEEITDYDLSGYDKNNEGQQTVTVTYQGKNDAFTVTVVCDICEEYPCECPEETVSIFEILGVAAPVAGLTPVVSITETEQYTGTVSWSPQVTGEFAAFTEYTATITLTAKRWFKFAGVEEDAFTIAGAQASNDEDSGVIKAVFPQTGELIFEVTNGADNGAGSLRQVIAQAPANSVIYINGDVKTILLSDSININKNLTIMGNGVILTRNPSWTTTSTSSQLLSLDTGSYKVSLSRIHFKGGKASDYGAAIRNGATLIVESCIFNDNRTDGFLSYGGAIYNSGTLTVKGCTFYDNRATGSGGAIYTTTGTLNLTGNLFYNNNANSGRVVYRSTGTVTSGGYNVSDIALGTLSIQAGWTAHSTDKVVNTLSFSTSTFRLFPDSGVLNIITALPENYPTEDFYGFPVNAGAASGAVQDILTGGYLINITVNNTLAGEAVVSSGSKDENGLYSGDITITANANNNYEFSHWVINEIIETENPFEFTLAANASIQAVFERTFIVTSSSDVTGSATTAGTLRHALTNARDGDTIRFELQAPNNTITLTSTLPQITRSINIEGNGVTLTRSPTWAYSGTSQLLYINSSTAAIKINRMHFKGGRANDYSGGIRNNGNLILESCIFSDNQATSNASWGGAIYNTGTLTVNGCTFYENAAYIGGAIYNNGFELTMTGNLFYKNFSITRSPVVHRAFGSITSGGYNLVDYELGTGDNQSGWTEATGDKNINKRAVAPLNFKLLSDSSAVNAISVLPIDYPEKDFYGNLITNGAAAGAVQEAVSGGYVLDILLPNPAAGSPYVIDGEPDENGLYSGSITIAAGTNTGYEFSHWLMENNETYTENPLTLNLTEHTLIIAVNVRRVTVISNSDSNTLGTLRYALNNLQYGDIITISPFISTITLSSALPQITEAVTIIGNGVTITRSPLWTTSNATSQLLYINSQYGVVRISGVHFKGGRAETGGAIRKNAGTLRLESCIFNDNRATNSSFGAGYGGAIYNGSGILIVAGCTFYMNSASGTTSSSGGAIYNAGTGFLGITGNLFYGNSVSGGITSGYPIIYNASTATVESGGFNVADAAIGTGSAQSGWLANIIYPDRTFSVLGITGLPFNTTTFAPVDGLKNIVITTEYFFPTTDFRGATRDFPGAPGAVK